MTPRRPDDDRVLWDPGAQPERTHQAWTRTALGLVGCALLAIRLTLTSGVVALVLCLIVAGCALALAQRQRSRLESGCIAVNPFPVGAMTALVVALGAGALALVLTS